MTLGLSKLKESSCQCTGHRRCKFSQWVGKIPWRRKWQPTPEFLPGEFHEQRRLVGYSSWSRKELDMTEQLGTHNWALIYFLNNSPDFHIIPSITSFWIISLMIYNQVSWIYKILIHEWWLLSVSLQNQSVVMHTFYSWEFWIIENFNEILYSISSLFLSLYTTSSQLSFTRA